MVPTKPSGIKGWCFLCQSWHQGNQYAPSDVSGSMSMEKAVTALSHLYASQAQGIIDRKKASELGLNFVLSTLVSVSLIPEPEKVLEEKIWMLEILAFAKEMFKADEKRSESGKTPRVEAGGAGGSHPSGEGWLLDTRRGDEPESVR